MPSNSLLSAPNQSLRCPVTGLPITSKPEWTEIHLGSDYSVTFSIIGKAILLITPKGYPSEEGAKALLEKRAEVIEEAGLSAGNYVELRDYRMLSGSPPKTARIALTNFLLKEGSEGHLQGFWVFGAPLHIRIMFQVGLRLLKTSIPIGVAKDYREALLGALKVLRRSGVDVGLKIYPSLKKEGWAWKVEEFGVSFELVGDDILYTIARGKWKESHVDPYLDLHKKVLHEAGLDQKGYYYRVLNWEGLETSTWKARRMYMEGLREIHKKTPCRLLVIFGLNNFMRTLVRLTAPIVPLPVMVAKDFQDALEITEREREKRSESARKRPKPKEKIYTEEDLNGFANEMLQVIGGISWDQAGLSLDGISEEHPLKPVLDALAIIKLDLDNLLQEKENSQKSLQESETLQRTLLANLPAGVVIIDPVTRMIENVNNSAAAMFGGQAEHLVGHRCHALLCPVSEGACPVCDLGQAVDNAEQEMICADGRRRPVLKSVKPIQIRGQEKLLECFVDITGRKQAEEALRESEEKYRNILESIEDGYFEVDLRGNFTFFNPSICTILGYPREEMQGMNNRTFLDRENSKRVFEAFNQIYVTGISTKGFEWEIIQKDGTRKHLEVSVSLIVGPGGKSSGFRGIARDVSERKEIELELKKHREHLQERISERTRELARTTNYLENILNSSLDGIVTTDVQGKILFTSPSVKDILGYEPGEVTGKQFQMLSAGGLEESEKIMDEVREKGEIRDYELRAAKKNGEAILLNLSIALLRDEKDEVTGTTSVYRDVTEKRKMAEAIEQAKRRAEAANKAKSQFLANMSHEIRTPLNGILGMAEVCLETKLDEEQKHIVGTITKEAASLLVIINEILDFSKIEAGKLEIEQVPFDLKFLLEDVTGSFSYQMDQKGLELISFISPDVPTRVVGDPGRLRQVLRNLIGNAIKFTHEGKISVKAELAQELGEKIKLRFLVIDTGIGIPKEKQAIVFESFTQADNSTTRTYGGTGLGTTISKQLAELMGGAMGVDSEEGKGSTFWFTSVFSKQRETDLPRIKEVPLSHVRVLVVDDNKTDRQTLTEYLRSWGSVPVEAASAKEALSILKGSIADRERFHLVLSHLNLPEMNGFDLTREIRRVESLSSIPIIILTSFGTPGDGKTCRDIGIEGYLTKPISARELRRAIETVLGPAMSGESSRGRDLVTRHSSAEADRKEIRILLAEDYPTNQEIARRHLEHAGYQVDLAEDGKQALEAFKRKHYDLILMDIQMPHLDGYQATKAIRELESELAAMKNMNAKEMMPRVPIIAMTAHATKEYRELCFETGMDDFLSKPLTRKELLAMAEKWLTSRPRPSNSSGAVLNPPSKTDPDISPIEVHPGKPIDWERAIKEFEGDETFLSEVIAGFTKKVSEQIGTIRQALSCGDAETVRKEAHSIKGGAANLTAEPLSRVASELEGKGKSKELNGAGEIVDGLEREFETLRRYVQENFPKPSDQ